MVNKKDWKWRSSVEKTLAGKIQKVKTILDDLLTQNLNLTQLTTAVEAIGDTAYWKDLSWQSAFDMVRTLSNQNATTWREAARESRNSRKIYTALRSEFKDNAAFRTIIASNAHYIRSVPADIALHITEHIAGEAIKGLRAESILQSVRKAAPDIAVSRARLIARTETAKSQSAIVQVRAQQIGIDWYQWDTSNDTRVRHSHQIMDDIYCQFSSPPCPEALDPQYKGHQFQYYNPGNIWNCRCSAYPIFDVDLIKFPIRAIVNNRIVKLNKRDFLALQ